MVENKVTILCAALCLFASCRGSDGYSWKKIPVDGSRTGVTACGADDAAQCIGVVENGVYKAPNGREFSDCITSAQAEILLGLQEGMHELKQVVGYVPEAMIRNKKESGISNMVVDIIMDAVAKATWRRVDVGFANFGGMRVDFAQGPLLLDDVRALLPFRNKLAFVRIKGSNLRKLFAQMGVDGYQAIGGAKVVFKGSELVGAYVQGRPLDDNRTYGLATIDFLLDGGDHFRIGDLAESVYVTDILILEPFEKYVYNLQKAGKPMQYKVEGRIMEI